MEGNVPCITFEIYTAVKNALLEEAEKQKGDQTSQSKMRSSCFYLRFHIQAKREKKKTKKTIAYAFNSAVQLYSSLFTSRTEETTLLRVFTKRKHSSFAQTRIKRQVQSFTSRLRYHCSSASALSKGAGASQAGKRPVLPARSCPSSPSSCSMTPGGRADGQPPASP